MNKRLNPGFIIPMLAFLIPAIFLYFLMARIYKKPEKINIILIMGDSLRGDHLGCYGYARNTSPNIDKFSRRSTLYENCFSPGTWTIPSNYSLLTSLYPAQHKVINWGMKLDNTEPNLVSFLHSRGYSFGIFGSNTLLLKTIKEQFPDYLNGYEETGDATSTTSAALGWIKEQKGKHFFAWIYYLNPHRPYSPPPPHNKMFISGTDNRLAIGKAEREPLGGWDSIPSLIVKNGINNPDYYRDQYDGEIHYLDEEVGRLMEGLKKMGLFQDSLVIFTSDHGESLGEHRLYFNHTFTLFNEIIKVPLLVKFPLQKRGRRVKENVSLVDIFPTVLHQLRAPVLRWLEGRPLEGNIDPSREIFSSNDTRKISALIQNGYKLIRYPPEAQAPERKYISLFFPDYSPHCNMQLFNLRNDPYEKSDIKSIEKQRYADMAQKLRDFESRAGNIGHKERGSFELKEQFKDKLKSLGYMQ